MKHLLLLVFCFVTTRIFSQNETKPVKFVNPAGVAKPTGYSHSAIVDLGNSRMVIVSGQVALDSAGNLVGKGDFAKQAEQVFTNIRHILRAAGGDMQHIVKTGIFVVDLSRIQAFREVRNRFLNSQNPPASTLVQVSRLYREDLLLEIEVTAIIPR